MLTWHTEWSTPRVFFLNFNIQYEYQEVMNSVMDNRKRSTNLEVVSPCLHSQALRALVSALHPDLIFFIIEQFSGKKVK